MNVGSIAYITFVADGVVLQNELLCIVSGTVY